MYFITGTDTDVGKSVISLLLMKFFIYEGKNPFYIKAIQTGVSSITDKSSDAAFVYDNMNVKDDNKFCKKTDAAIKKSMPLLFKEPKAPYFAAKNEDAKIDLNILKDNIKEAQKEYSPIVIEGAGGLFVPIYKNYFMIDLIKELSCKTIVVGRAGLGTINHCLLSLEALKQQDILVEALILSKTDNTDSLMIEENIRAIKDKYPALNVELVEYIDDFNDLDRYFSCFKFLK